MLDHVSELLRAQRAVSTSPRALVRTADVEAAVAADVEAAKQFMSRQEFSDKVLIAYIEKPDWRLGQTAYNTACFYWPEVRHLVDKPDTDPFYEDRNLGAFMDWLFPNGEPRRVR